MFSHNVLQHRIAALLDEAMRFTQSDHYKNYAQHNQDHQNFIQYRCIGLTLPRACGKSQYIASVACLNDAIVYPSNKQLDYHRHNTWRRDVQVPLINIGSYAGGRRKYFRDDTPNPRQRLNIIWCDEAFSFHSLNFYDIYEIFSNVIDENTFCVSLGSA